VTNGERAALTLCPDGYTAAKILCPLKAALVLGLGGQMPVHKGVVLLIFGAMFFFVGAVMCFAASAGASQSNSALHATPGTTVADPHCPGKDKAAIMCRLINDYRAKHGLKAVQLDPAVSRESQYWSDQLDLQNACWFLYHDSNYHSRMRARFPGRKFRENAACSGSTGGGAEFILQKWIDSAGHRENMLTSGWKMIGVGVTKNIWVINFTN
jgi:uncharacterized protein YkwD